MGTVSRELLAVSGDGFHDWEMGEALLALLVEARIAAARPVVDKKPQSRERSGPDVKCVRLRSMVLMR